MLDVVTQPMTLEDTPEVLTLQRAAFASEAQIYRDPFLPALTQTEAELRREIDDGFGLVCRHGHRMVAAVRWTIERDTLHIGRLTVAPDMQGNGLGTLLLREAEGRCGAAIAELFTGHMSEANIRLYNREGYAENRREHVRDGIELVYLSKKL